jgi:hypothetical protein
VRWQLGLWNCHRRKDRAVETMDLAPELAQSLAGSSNREIGEERGYSHEHARRIVQAQSREIVSRYAGLLLLARRDGLPLVVATIPDSGPGLSLGLRWVDYLVGQLAGVMFRTRVVIEPVNGGYSIALAELTDVEEG